MTEDLAARVLAAIKETERAACGAGDDALDWLRGWIEISSVETDAVIAHFERHETNHVLRRCEADRRTVERHVTNGLTCRHCSRLWPCPDLLDRAMAYDITTEETTHG